MISLQKKHHLIILVLDGFIPFDVSVAYNIFSQVELKNGHNPYEISICSYQKVCTSHEWQITSNKTLSDLVYADTIIIPGLENPVKFNNQQVLQALQVAAAKGVRIASICTGAFILAASGLLDDLQATTHWNAVDDLAKKYPQIKVEPDILFADNGQFLTSAGLVSGTDLCLHMVRKDYGSTVAEKCAQLIVMPIEREGYYKQLIRRTLPEKIDLLNPILYWLVENLHLNHTLQSLAQKGNMSVRTLNRKFKEKIGMSPMSWIAMTRIKRAQSYLESTTLSIEHIATIIGFNSATSFREKFRKAAGMTPSNWRKRYKMSITSNEI